jgi:subtilisin family serine protease
VIDTGVDPSHPLLEQALVPGYDFLLDEGGTASEFRALPGQSLTTVVEQSLTTVVEADTMAVLAGQGTPFPISPEIAPILATESVEAFEQLDLPPYFGHGTMVAGMVHLAAPNASIMPLRVFDAHGQGELYDIVRAIYWAVDHGADILNLSFTLSGRSRELQEALAYAEHHGVVAIAAAGNRGEHELTFPAGYGSVVGVAATTHDDHLAEFSNYGNQLVQIAAPGAGVISTYPGNHYAAGWGTSFAAPLAAGGLALVLENLPGDDLAASRERARVLRESSWWLPGLAGKIGSGRLDLFELAWNTDLVN